MNLLLVSNSHQKHDLVTSEIPTHSRRHHAVIWVNGGGGSLFPFGNSHPVNWGYLKSQNGEAQGKSLQSPLQTSDWRTWNSVRVCDTKVTNLWNYQRCQSPLKKPNDQDTLSSAAGGLCSTEHCKTGIYFSSEFLNNQARICNHTAEGRSGVNVNWQTEFLQHARAVQQRHPRKMLKAYLEALLCYVTNIQAQSILSEEE